MVLRLTIALSVAALGAALSATPASAQMRIQMGGGAHGPAAQSPTRITIGGGQRGRFGRGHRGRRGFSRGGVVYPYPYWYPYGGYEEGTAPAEQPPVRVVVVNAPPVKAPAPATPPPESLLLQYQNGQWVRVPTGNNVPVGPLSAQPESAQAPAPKANTASGNEAVQAPAKPRNVILVFRDGHKEKIQNYVIQGDLLYASEEYWRTGSWTEKIPIAELNIPATLRLNRKRGVKFDLPSGPNEVVVGF